MREASLLDLPHLRLLIGEQHFTKIRNDLIVKTNKWIIEEDMAILFESLGNGKWQVHIYTSGGKKARDFAVRAGRYMIDLYGATAFLNFVARDRMDLRFFMRMIGSKKLATVGDEILYISTGDMGIKEN